MCPVYLILPEEISRRIIFLSEKRGEERKKTGKLYRTKKLREASIRVYFQ